MKKIYLSVLIIFLAVADSNAFQAANPGYVIAEEGSKLMGSIDTKGLKSSGTIIFSMGDGNQTIYGASDIGGFSIDGVNEVLSENISYYVNNEEKKEGIFFTKKLIEGSVKLHEVFGASFDYALTKDEESNGLQRIKNPSNFGPTYFDNYKGTFYLAFIDCEEGIRTDRIEFKLSEFITAVEEYNLCINPEYEVNNIGKEKDSHNELEFSLGTSNSKITAIYDGVNDYEYNESSESHLKLLYKSNFPHKNVFFGIGLVRKKYEFTEKTRSRSSNNISFSEIQIPVLFEYRTYTNVVSFSAYSGLNYHTNIRGLDTKKYASITVGLNLGVSTSEKFEVGISLDTIKRLNYSDLKSENNIDFNFDQDFFFGLFFRYKNLEY